MGSNLLEIQRELRNVSRKLLGTLGLVAVGFCVLVVIAFHFLQPDNDPVQRAVSTYVYGDFGWMMKTALIVVGIGTIAMAQGLREALSNGRSAAVSWILVLAAGIGFVFAGVFSGHPSDEVRMTTNGIVHFAAALVLMVAMTLSAWFLRPAFKGSSGRESLRPLALVFGVALVIALFLTFSETDWPGLVQRIFLALITAWLGILAWHVRSRNT